MRLAAVIALLLAGLLLLAFANASGFVGGLVPHPPKGKGEHCIAPTDFMRRNHMSLMRHQRDETVHEGVRGKPFSLEGCVECHAVKGADGQDVTYASSKHFCRSCHDYAAVSIDCFECHASRPGEGKAKGAGLAIPNPVEFFGKGRLTPTREGRGSPGVPAEKAFPSPLAGEGTAVRGPS